MKCRMKLVNYLLCGLIANPSRQFLTTVEAQQVKHLRLHLSCKIQARFISTTSARALLFRLNRGSEELESKMPRYIQIK